LEREAKYASVALFALACLAAAVAFVWWYSGRGDQRDYTRYEIYFEGSVSGLAKGSPVRYLGVDVGRVEALAVDKDNPRRVKVIAEVDSTAPISGATLAKLGLLGLTGLLYIDLQQDSKPGAAVRPLQRGERYPVIAARKGTIEASLERLPDLLNQTAAVMQRIEALLDERNVRAVSATLENVQRATTDLPAVVADVRTLMSELHQISNSTLKLTESVQGTLEHVEPDLALLLTNARVASEKLARTTEGLERLVNANDGALGRSAGANLVELQQLVIDARAASDEVRELARTLREQPSSLLREPKESGVEIPR
jgi:phospholipid/cholesterol/gamma-HCH transport system substrate-binding protein